MIYRPFPFPAFPRTRYPALIVNAALTGMVPQRDKVPHVPITTEEIADDAERCFEAGATIVHLHARDTSGRPERRRDAYADLIPEGTVAATNAALVERATATAAAIDRPIATPEQTRELLGLPRHVLSAPS